MDDISPIHPRQILNTVWHKLKLPPVLHLRCRFAAGYGSVRTRCVDSVIHKVDGAIACSNDGEPPLA